MFEPVAQRCNYRRDGLVPRTMSDKARRAPTLRHRPRRVGSDRLRRKRKAAAFQPTKNDRIRPPRRSCCAEFDVHWHFADIVALHMPALGVKRNAFLHCICPLDQADIGRVSGVLGHLCLLVIVWSKPRPRPLGTVCPCFFVPLVPVDKCGLLFEAFPLGVFVNSSWKCCTLMRVLPATPVGCEGGDESERGKCGECVAVNCVGHRGPPSRSWQFSTDQRFQFLRPSLSRSISSRSVLPRWGLVPFTELTDLFLSSPVDILNFSPNVGLSSALPP